MRVVTDLEYPHGIACNSRSEIIITECWGHKVSTFDISGRKNCRVRNFGSFSDSQNPMEYPGGTTVDYEDNIYVTSEHKLQKFTSSGQLIDCVGLKGEREEEFDDPRGVTLYDNQLYVCDYNNHRIQVFNLDLNFVQTIGSYGEGRGEFNGPLDVKFDAAGNMYIAELANRRIQVLPPSAH